MTDNFLQPLLAPASIAIAGASTNPHSEAWRLVRNLLDGDYQGKLFLVNARHKLIQGQTVFKSLRNLPETPDLAIILTPEITLERMIRNCAEAGIKLALIMTLSYQGPALTRYARSLGVRLLGPTSAGVISPGNGLNATYSKSKIARGTVAVVSQSATLVSAVLDWADSSGVGFSALVSTGFESDITTADIIDYLATDHHTRAIILYLDHIRHSRAFLSALSAAARNKPVLLMKSSRDSARFCDALTRTGTIYSSDRVFQAALERAGAVRIRTFSNLFSAAKTLSSGVRTQGKRLAIVSNGSAPAMLACDRIQTKGFELVPLPESVVLSVGSLVGDNWSGVNPVVLRNYDSMLESYAATIKELLHSDEYDAVMALYSPDPRCDPLALAKSVEAVAAESHKPVLTCWMGESQVNESRTWFSENNILSFRTPEAATDAFDFIYRYYRSQQLLLQSPEPVQDESEADFTAARNLLNHFLAQGMRVLPHEPGVELMSTLAIPMATSRVVASADEACQYAQGLGYPVALKLASPQLRFHPLLNGIELNLSNSHQVDTAYKKIRNFFSFTPEAEPEIILESMAQPPHSRVLAVRVFNDPTFSRTLSIGFGGDMQSVIYQRPVQLPPLNEYLINDMLDDEHLANYLGRYRQKPAVNYTLLADFLHSVSAAVCELPEIYELDFNAVVLNHESLVAADVQVTLQNRAASQSAYNHLSIHPYPRKLAREVVLDNGKRMLIRPIKAEDGEGIATLINNMSAESRYMRFMHVMDKLPPKMIAQFSKIDYDRQMAFCAIPQDQPHTIVGVSRYAINPDHSSSEFAIETADDWHGKGLSKHLMAVLIDRAKQQKLKFLEGIVLRNNHSMRGLMESMGFACTPSAESYDLLVCKLSLACHS